MKTVIALTGLAAVAAAATAGPTDGPVATYTISDLDASYSSASEIFSASAGSNSAGDFTRPSTSETATFGEGFADSTSASYTVDIGVSNNNGVMADGLGSFTFTDVDGDSFSGTVSGVWTNGGFGAIFFTGALSNVTFDSSGGNGTFDGTSGDSASIPAGGPFEGSIVQLTFNLGGDFFLSDFDDANTLVSAQLIPTPGALALVGLAGLAGVRRRR